MERKYLYGSSPVEILESRKKQLLERKRFTKDKEALKKIGKQLKEIEAMLKEYYAKTGAKTQRVKKKK